MMSQAQSLLTISYDDNYIKNAKQAVINKDPDKLKALDAFVKQANKALKVVPPSVADKDKVPPSGDKRDYMSLAPYWFPDSTKPDGKPYIRRDGVRNPEIFDYKERENIKVMGDGAINCAVVYYFTGDEQYAQKAADFLRAWFLDPQKGMNPNFNYAQAVIGRNEGRGAGLIEARIFIPVMNAAKLLEGSKAWTDKDKTELQAWFKAFLEWMETSKVGKEEMAAQNNHGTFYDASRLAMCLYTDQFSKGKDIVNNSALNRIFNQQTKDGEMPHELVRTLAMHYTTFNLEAMVLIATMAEKIDIDVYNYTDGQGRNIQRYVDFMLPYYAQEEEWTYPQIKPFDYDRAATLLQIFGVKMHTAEYIKVAERITSNNPKAKETLLGQQSITQ
ncbi:alginate lyase [Bacteroidia bacterium]|nr:alginate lyase [Bacteroidia bacterium]